MIFRNVVAVPLESVQVKMPGGGNSIKSDVEMLRVSDFATNWF